MKILVLGGTAEAREVCTALVSLGQEVTLSLAGRTSEPNLPEGVEVRSGGYGGPEGLAVFLRSEGFNRIVDATHPYSVQMSTNAFVAAQTANIPLIRLSRPGWIEPHYAFWIRVPNFEAAAAALPNGARAFLTIGHKGLEAFYGRTDCTFLIRTIEVPEYLPPHCWAIESRPPFYVREEAQLMRRERITHLVSKNSGGAQTEAKLFAAQSLTIKTIIVERPEKPPAREVQSIGRCIAALRLQQP